MNEIALDAFWYLAAERQNIFFRRLDGGQKPYTNDDVLLKYSFTNSFRASDRVSQYLIKNVIYSGDASPEEVLFRILFFKFFNSIETWESINRKLEEISCHAYSYNRYDKALVEVKKENRTIYSPAYIIPSGSSYFGSSFKHQNNLRLIELMFDRDILGQLQNSKSLENVYNIFLSFPSIGPFLAFQYTIDVNYSELINFNESEFVVAGPGAVSGIRKCFGNISDKNEQLIMKLVENQDEEFKKRNIDFKNLWGRKLQPIDIQNLFCEVDKYCRAKHPSILGVGGRTRIKRKFVSNKLLPEVWYPPKWGINKKVKSHYESKSSLTVPIVRARLD